MLCIINLVIKIVTLFPYFIFIYNYKFWLCEKFICTIDYFAVIALSSHIYIYMVVYNYA